MSQIGAPRSPTEVALVGCGAVAELYYAPALRELARVGLLRVRVLLDPDSAKAERLRAHFPMARIHDDVAELAQDAVDLAIVASPPRVHAAQAIQLLRRGVSVLCEKPMAASVSEAEAMVEAAAAARRVLAVGLVRRFLPACQTIRAILSHGILGDVRSFRFMEGGRFRWPTQSPSYFQRGAAVGGVLADIGSHLLDLVTWWMGEPAHIRYEDDAMGGIELNCLIELRFAGGLAGVVRLSRDCELRGGYFIRGTKGWLRWSVSAPDELQMQFDGTPAAILGRLHEHDPSPALAIPLRRVRNFEQSFVAQLRNVVAAVQGNDEAFVTGRDALPGLRLVEHCYRHRSLMPMGWLDEREQARAESLAREVRAC
jgi:predicted dehydrogenase